METIEQIVRNILDGVMGCRKVGERYEVEIYVAYDDGMSDQQIREIAKAKDKRQRFEELLDEYVTECMWQEEVELMKAIEEDWPEPEETDDGTEPADYVSFEGAEDEVRDIVYQLVDFNFPYDHYKKQDVRVNILMNTGDGNYDFTLNNWLEIGTTTIDDESALLWLCKQQGYSKRQVKKAVWNNEYADSKFLKSVYVELANAASSMNALTFFVSMTLGEYMDWMDEGGDIVVSKDTACGLYDPWNGSGSVLEIQLEKDVRIPRRFAEPHIDGARGYSVDSIYGMSPSFWDDTVLEIKKPRGAKQHG